MEFCSNVINKLDTLLIKLKNLSGCFIIKVIGSKVAMNQYVSNMSHLKKCLNCCFKIKV